MSAFQDLLNRSADIEIAVDYYDRTHEKALGEYPNAADIRTFAGTTQPVPVSEFLTYCLFVNKRPAISPLSSYDSIRGNLDRFLGDFDAGFETTATSLRTIQTGNDQLAGLSEKLGSGGALALISQLHGLTEADWGRIPVGPAKSLDYDFACTNGDYVQVEAKGTSVPDNTANLSLSHFARDIGAKKAALRADPGNVSVIAYGVVTAIDQRPAGVIRSWLLDPPGMVPSRPPLQQRVLNRLRFVAGLLEATWPGGSAITLALYKRLSLLATAEDVFEFDRIPVSDTWEKIVPGYFHERVQDAEQTFSGRMFPLNTKDGSRLFVGARRELLETALTQDFKRLLEPRWRSESRRQTLEIPAPETGIDGRRPEPRPRRYRSMLCNLHFTSSGRVFGLIGQ